MPLNDFLFNAFWITIYIFVIIAFFAVIFNAVIKRKRKKFDQVDQFKLTFLQVRVPQQDETEIQAAENLLNALTGFRRTSWDSFFKGPYRISFEIVSKTSGIGFYVVVPNEIVHLVEKQLNGAYPTAEIDEIDPNEIWDRGAFTSIAEIKLAGPTFYPIKTFKDFEHIDPLGAITSSMSKLKNDEVVALQYVIAPASNSWRSLGRSYIAQLRTKSAHPEKGGSVDTSSIEGVEKKIAKAGFDVKIRIVSISEDSYTSDSHLSNIASAFEQFTDVNYNRFKMVRRRSVKEVSDFIYRRINTRNLVIPIFNITLSRNTSVLNTAELATVFHFPNKNVHTPNILWLGAQRAPAPSNTPAEGLYLGKNVYRNTEKKIYMKTEDRARHFYIIGQTGTGKSVFMSSLAIQDIYNGHGVAYIDPHGTEIDKLLQLIPEERINDVILFDVSDTERPLGLNVLEAETVEQRNMVINAFIALLYKLYDPNRTGIMGPKLERAIRNVMLTAMIEPESTLVDVLRLLIDNDYSKKFIPRIEDPLVKKFWTDEVAKTSDFHKSETMGYFVSKFDRFVTEVTMRNILGQPSSAFNFNEIMAKRKILLVDLSKGKIGEENSNFLGLILVPKILNAALGRAKLIGKEEFPPFYLYVDEFQNFATPDFATILSEARKYKLNLTVAHQFVAQLIDEIKNAIFGNVGSMAVFRVGTEDGDFLEPQFDPIFKKNDLINNAVGNACMRLLIDGHPSKPFSLAVDWKHITALPTSKDIAQRIRENSRMTYGRDRAEVENYINKRAGFFDEPAKPAFDPKKLIPF